MNTLDTLFAWMINASLRASALVVIVLVVRGLAGNRLPARWRYALWLPVLAALVLPGIPILPAPNSAVPLAQMEPPARPAAPPRVPSSPARPTEKLTPPPMARSEAPILVDEPEPSLPPVLAKKDDASSSVSAPVVAPRSLPDPFPWRNLFSAVWLAGVLLAAAVVGSSYLLILRRIRRSAVPVPPELVERIALLAESLGLRRVPQVWLSPAVASPAVGGWLRPVLLLNANFPADLTEEEAEMVLRHELTHIRRGDLLFNPLLCGLLALHWFNPLLWLAFSRIRADREAACDADVLRDSNDARRAAYGKTLLKMETAFPPSGMCLGFVGILQRGSMLRERIQSIIARPKPSLMLRSTLVLGIIGLAIIGLARAAEARKVVTPEEFKEHFARVGMAETMHHTEFLGVTNGVAGIRTQTMNPLTRKWKEQMIEIEVEKLDPAFRAEVEKAKPTKTPPPFTGRGEWSEEIQGLSCRITPEKTEYIDGEAIRVLLEVRNTSSKPVTLAFEPRAGSAEIHKVAPPQEGEGVKFTFSQEKPQHLSSQLQWFPNPVSPAARATLLKPDGKIVSPVPVQTGRDKTDSTFVLGPNETYSEMHWTTIGLTIENPIAGEIQPETTTLTGELGLLPTKERGKITLKSNPVGITTKSAPRGNLSLGSAHGFLRDRENVTVTVSGNVQGMNAFSLSKKDLGTPIAKSDPIYPALEQHKSGIQKRYDEKKEMLPAFSDWYQVESPAAKQLFPSLRFAKIAWNEDLHPEAKGNVVGRAVGLVNIVGVNTASNNVEAVLWTIGDHKEFVELLRDHHVRIQNESDAKTLWQAFYDLRDMRWHDNSISKKSDTVWQVSDLTHQGMRQYYEVILDDQRMVKSIDSGSEKVSPTKPKDPEAEEGAKYGEVELYCENLHPDGSMKNATSFKGTRFPATAKFGQAGEVELSWQFVEHRNGADIYQVSRDETARPSTVRRVEFTGKPQLVFEDREHRITLRANTVGDNNQAMSTYTGNTAVGPGTLDPDGGLPPNPPAAFEGRGEWGAEADGLSCRVTPDKTDYEIGDPVRLLVEVRNTSDAPLSLGFGPLSTIHAGDNKPFATKQSGTLGITFAQAMEGKQGFFATYHILFPKGTETETRTVVVQPRTTHSEFLALTPWGPTRGSIPSTAQPGNMNVSGGLMQVLKPDGKITHWEFKPVEITVKAKEVGAKPVNPPPANDDVPDEARHRVADFEEVVAKAMLSYPRSPIEEDEVRNSKDFQDWLLASFANLNEKDMRLKAAAILSKRLFKDDELAAKLVGPLIRDEDLEVKLAAARAIGNHNWGARYAGELAAMLDGNPSDTTVLTVVLAMSRVTEEALRQPVVNYLEKLTRSPDAKMRLKGVDAMIRFYAPLARQKAPERPWPWLLPLLDDPDAFVRGTAVDGLPLFGANGVELALRMLDDTKPHVRERALRTLEKLHDPKACGAPPAAQNPDANEASFHGDDPCLLPQPLCAESCDAIAKRLADPDPDVRAMAAAVLGRLQATQHMAGVIAMLGDREFLPRLWAVEALGEMGGPGQIAHLRPLLRDPEEQIRTAAEKSVAVLTAKVSKAGQPQTISTVTDLHPAIDDGHYRAVTQSLLTKVVALKARFPILEKMQVPEVAANGEATLAFEHGVTWVLDDPTQKASKTNGQRAVFEKNGLHFRLHFYRGRWEGAAMFIPVNFGDLNLWFTYEYRQGDDPAIIVAISKIIQEEKVKFEAQSKRIVDSVYVLPNGYRGPVFVAQVPEVLPEVAERQKNTLMVTTVDEKGEGVSVGAIKPIFGWEYREIAKQRDGVKIKTADDDPAENEVAWRQIAGYAPWKRGFRPQGFAAYYVGTKAEAEAFRVELERLVNLYTDEEAEAFRAKLGTLKYPITTQAACEALGIDLKRLTGESGTMKGMASGVTVTSWVELSGNYSISFHSRISVQGEDGKWVQNEKGLLHQVSIYTRVETRSVRKKDDKVEVSIRDDALFVDVLSPSGIGDARLALTSGAWPKKVVVRLKYAADRPFTRLEGPGATLEEEGKPGEQLEVRLLEDNGFEAEIPATGRKVLNVSWIDAYRN